MNFHVMFFKQKTAYEMRSSDWSSDVCSSDLQQILEGTAPQLAFPVRADHFEQIILLQPGLIGYRPKMQGEPFVETIPPRPARSIFDETGKIVAGGLGHLPDNHDIDADLFGNGCPLPVSGPGGQSLAHGQQIGSASWRARGGQ